MRLGQPDGDPRSANLRRIERGVEERLARMAEAVRALNVKVEMFNSLVPVESLQLVPHRVETFI